MYARVLTFQTQSGKNDQILQITQNVILPGARQQQGFKRLFLLTDDRTGKSMAISLWETEADMTASEGGGFLQGLLNKVTPRLTASPVVETFEVSIHE